VENEFIDYDRINEVFRLNGKVTNYTKPKLSWRDRFIESGFYIECDNKSYCRSIHERDNELGRIAVKLGVDIETKSTMYVVKKI